MTEAQGPAASPLSAVSNVLGDWGRGLAVLIALLYAAGFLVVNSYLGSFGVRDLEPLRTRYVAAAIPFLGLAALAAFFGIQTHDAMVRFATGASRPVWAALLIARLPVVAVVVTLTTLSVMGGLRASVPSLFPSGWAGLADVTWFGMGSVLAVLTYRARRRDWRTWLGALLALTFASTGTLGLLAYARTIYPAIPPWLGGGRPDVVNVVVEDAETVCPACVAGPVKLLDEDSSRFVFLVDRSDGSRVAIEVARSAVRSITHSPVPR